MSDLSPETRALLKRVSSADDPTQADRDRVLAMIGGALVAPIVPAPGGTAGAGTAGAVATGGTVKLVLAFVISLGVGGVATTAGTSLFRASKPAPIVEQVVVPPPPLVVEALPAVVPAVEPEPAVVAAVPPPVETPMVRKPPPAAVVVAPTPVETPEVVVDRPVARRDDTCELSAELTVIQQAQQALKTNPAQAIAGLDAFGARCPSGALLEERLATRALALCASGKKDDGRTAAQELGERFPASPSLDRVNQACGQ